jgi:transcriptional regulator with XRE-family HTH domain
MEPTHAQGAEFKPMTVAASSPIDKHIGARIRMRRLLLGIQHEALAEMIGATIHELWKHEVGEKRIDAKRLFHIAHALKVPASYFFEELDRRASRALI